MFRFVVVRILSMLAVVLAIVSAVFILTRLIPADPARLVAGFDAGEEQVEAVREALGLNRPIWEQYLIYMRDLIHLDFGQSIRTQQPVWNDLKRFAPATLELAGVCMLLLTVLSIPLGLISATSGRFADAAIRLVAIIGAAIPPFWLALLLQLVFYGGLGLLPSGGRLDFRLDPPPVHTGLYLLDSLVAGRFDAFFSAINHLILPVTALVLGRLALTVRLTRSFVLVELRQDHIRNARAKGLTERIVMYRHVLRNVLIPVVTVLGVQFGYLLGGTFLIEIIFLWPGLGRYAVEAISTFDYNAITGVALLVSTGFALINFLLDVGYGWLDPKVRLS